MIATIIRPWMERLKVKISDPSGVTLIELLVTITIASILLPLTYGTFITGYKIYDKISIEGQLREDADYVSSLIMQEMYALSFDYIEQCGSQGQCITFVNAKNTTVDKPKGKEFYDVGEESASSITETTLQLVEVNGKSAWKFGNSIFETPSSFAGSTVTFDCSQQGTTEGCKNAILDFQYTLENPRLKRTLTLESRFGF
ncbi:PilW family protein [Bacillus sp. 2205SS5-2]|uniref:PilW family protein n=1 Tax=Bacillus sp. 2205SS5-2 TaxID=3109031 RepID=UPI0030068560